MAVMINAITGRAFEVDDKDIMVYLRRGHMLAAVPLDAGEDQKGGEECGIRRNDRCTGENAEGNDR